MTGQSVGRKTQADVTRSLDKAERILRDELLQGCTDRLVNGGLESFLRFWRGEIERLCPTAPALVHVERVVGELSGYRALGSSHRQHAISRALAELAAARAALATLDAHRTQLTGANQSQAAAIRRSPGPAPTPAVVRPGPAPPSRPRERHPLDLPLADLKGIGPARARALARLGLRTWGDLLHHYPSRHEPFPPPRSATDLLFVQRASFEGEVRDIQTSTLNRGLRKITARLADSTGSVLATWLRAGSFAFGLKNGQRIAVSGNVTAFGRQVVFENPDWEPADSEPVHTRRLVPVYPLTGGVAMNWLRQLIHRAVRAEASHQPDFLPPEIRQAVDLPPYGRALEQLHFPDSQEALEQARRRLAFDELFLLQLIVLKRRQRRQAEPSRALVAPPGALQILLAAQPYRLTNAQERVISEISADLGRATPMSRLLQGEVGSGKTAVAAVALYIAVASGGQAVLMAPTEILAEQHYRTLRAFYEQAGSALRAASYPVPRVALLTGSTSRRQKEATYLALRDGEIDVLVGTQAVIQEGVEPRRLALSIVDEQHRFGVRQRAGLREKGSNPHLLVMTATPIPRTLALTLHGDLDLSLIDEMPPGRQKVRTHLLGPAERALAYEHIRREAARGRQAFLICPLVDDSPNLEARAATEEYERLRVGELSNLRLGLLHGRMKPAEKDDVMRRFRDREFDVLVSTAVVEVGVDIPNATVMLIEGAERFGLAQLHQFRGRVGRGQHPSTCILLTDVDGGDSIERLAMMVRSNNGLQLAEFDLQQRGPGDFLGIRQSGLPELRVATLTDAPLLEAARSAAARLLAHDPELDRPEHRALAGRLANLVQRVGEPN